MADLILNFKQVDKGDVGLVGGKGANLGELTKAKISVPEGFIVTASAYDFFIESANLKTKIENLLTNFNVNNVDELQHASSSIKKIILKAEVPNKLRDLINRNYRSLISNSNPYVAVRSSATAEDLPTASFAGQQETYLNISGEEEVCRAVQKAWASLFEQRAIFYREQAKFDHFKVKIAVPVQRMIQSDRSGVMFTVDPVSGNKNKVVIEAIYGLGELIVQGQVTPDHYEVSKTDYTILDKKIEKQTKQMVKVKDVNKILAVSKSWQDRQKLTDNQILELARTGIKIENHYFFSQDIEWAIEKDKIYIVQTRPVTTIQKQIQTKFELPKNANLKILAVGAPASPGIASGISHLVGGIADIKKIKKGDVLVATVTNPDYVPAMRKAVAVVTDRGGRTSHAAIVSRELGIPAVVGTGDATKKLKNGQAVTVDGGMGKVYKGALALRSKVLAPKSKQDQKENVLKTATRVYVNLAQPEEASQIAAMDVDGVGLLRAEFMVANIGIHPKKLIKDKKEKIFIDRLSEGVGTICQEFYPRPVVYRATDFKTNEYRGLVGGDLYEPVEANPLLGFRGAYRYLIDHETFRLEIEMIKTVRNKHNLKNLNLMIPFVHTVKEIVEIKKILAAHGLFRTPTFKLWMMVEIPSNVILIDQFIEAGIDGISIGSNDLTMLILGVDRDNEELAPRFDERDPAVLWALERVIKSAAKHNITSSICGQSVSSYADLVEKLVEFGISSVSVNPDAIENTRQVISHSEQRLIKKRVSYGKN